ncbi:MAG: hypothetical protein AB6733_20695 [Clostridiaceae bacterium]
MNFKVILKGILIGIVTIIVLLLFQKITKMEVPTWLGGIIIVALIGIVIGLKQEKKN